MAFAMAENGEIECRDTLLRIVQRDRNPEKIKKAQELLMTLAGSSNNNTSLAGSESSEIAAD